ncbi:alpha-1,2-mannosyltransferase ALG9 [Leguminivora glycinivorella]|uniref:alpha-1,2-mannosyltransferase ALG9 n=1 Tax=Leguminivora glycinivorella TaxID=1035111 RepID=UPI002010C254|nr:alpha-1,2-mannosyltransferase ALG9 [Leguminivora glycinivorella]
MPLSVRQRTIINKNGAKRTASFKGKRSSKVSEGDVLVVNAPSDLRSIAYPGGAVVLVLLLTARLLSSYYGHIADCDETYNYWEPLHYLVYGNGLQTWEYSPAFAIRSYMPLWLFAIPAKILAVFMSPVSIFYVLRALLASLSAIAELMFYKAICHEYGVHVGRVWLGLTLPAAGCFASSAAMLPSAWSSALTAVALASWWRRRYPAAVIFTAATALLSWPFTALIGVPIAIDMIFMKQQFVAFFKWSVISLVTILLPMVIVDSWQYGRLVIAPWNIVAYNIFTEHGPDLYGVEPWTYYFVNGFLNFNIVWILALSSPLLLLACTAISARSTARAPFCSPYWLGLMPLALWLIVFMLQPHKEERFLYPVYNMIVLAGAIGVDCLQKMTFAVGTELFRWRRMREKRHYLVYTGALMAISVSVAGIVSVSRITALYNNYNAPMNILYHLPVTNDTNLYQNKYVCFGKDWYRSPSSFHLPPEYRIRFVASEFNGQLPAPYSSSHNATRLVQPHFNDLNKGDNRTYLRPTECHYLVDTDIGQPTAIQPAYHRNSTAWEIVASLPILDAERSHTIFRAFYVPFLSNKHNVYSSLYLLKNKIIDSLT